MNPKHAFLTGKKNCLRETMILIWNFEFEIQDFMVLRR